MSDSKDWSERVQDPMLGHAAAAGTSLLALLGHLVGLEAVPLLAVAVAPVAWGRHHWATAAWAAATSALAALIGSMTSALSVMVAALLLAVVLAALRRAYDAEWQAARLDRLTGTLNRRGFDSALAKVAQQALHGSRGYLLVYADLDAFKSVNDTYGHGAGDTVLRAFAAAARRMLGPDDLLGRMGGDEFVLLVHPHEDRDPYSQAQAIHATLTAALEGLGYADLGCSMGTVIVEPPEYPSQRRQLKSVLRI